MTRVLRIFLFESNSGFQLNDPALGQCFLLHSSQQLLVPFRKSSPMLIKCFKQLVTVMADVIPVVSVS